LMIFLPLQLNFLQKWLGLTDLSGEIWLQCFGFVIFVLLVDELIKFFMRRRRKSKANVAVPAQQPL
jgi:hypothetical protein